MLADEPGEGILVTAPKRLEKRRFINAHGSLSRGDPTM